MGSISIQKLEVYIWKISIKGTCKPQNLFYFEMQELKHLNFLFNQGNPHHPSTYPFPPRGGHEQSFIVDISLMVGSGWESIAEIINECVSSVIVAKGGMYKMFSKVFAPTEVSDQYYESIVLQRQVIQPLQTTLNISGWWCFLCDEYKGKGVEPSFQIFPMI